VRDQPNAEKPRARQNVVFEHGLFVGKLGRDRVVALKKGDVEVPSDLDGVLYTQMDGNWKLDLIKEMRNAGLPVDVTKL
jgi:predicted nucleotide-binding protein